MNARSPSPAPNPRMRRLASQLGSIRISLDPPSPPPVVDRRHSAAQQRQQQQLQVFFDVNHLQVPAENDVPRVSSPPPDRRSSYASTASDNSSITIPMSSSYQSLLSPMWTSTKYSLDEYDTPPNEPITRPRSVLVGVCGRFARFGFGLFNSEKSRVRCRSECTLRNWLLSTGPRPYWIVAFVRQCFSDPYLNGRLDLLMRRDILSRKFG